MAILDQVEEAGHVDVGGFISREKLGWVLSTSRSFEGKTFLTAGIYDAYGRPETYRYPSGFETRNVSAPQGHLIEALQSGLRSLEVETMDAEGRVVRMKLGNCLVSTSTFDLWTGMLAELKTEDPGKAAVVQHSQFDPLGNLKSRSEQRGGKERGVRVRQPQLACVIH